MALRTHAIPSVCHTHSLHLERTASHGEGKAKENPSSGGLAVVQLPYLGGKLVLAAMVHKEGGVQDVVRHHGCIPRQDCRHKKSLREQLRSATGGFHRTT